jgi:hypothetical protein
MLGVSGADPNLRVTLSVVSFGTGVFDLEVVFVDY